MIWMMGGREGEMLGWVWEGRERGEGWGREEDVFERPCSCVDVLVVGTDL